ncbi:hypothetical protein KKG46_03080 [Patescibacteria group bacterium]|nr:hypothetical protein [Patescibacteria group bacterium]
MLLEIIISLIILSLAYAIRSFFADNLNEFNKPFLVVIFLFIIIYISATAFISYRLGAWGAETQSISNSKNSYIIDEPVQEIDLSSQY